MSHITIIDNTPNQKKSLPKYTHDCENLRKIANKTLEDLQSESGILIFPPRIEDTDDQIKDSVIFTLKESDNYFSLDTGNLMGFIGHNDTELNICSRFTHKDDKNSEKNDFFLHYMLEKVCHINLTNLKSTKSPDKIFDLLPFLFPQYLISALRQGVYKEYQKHEYNNSNVRGIIDINRHIRFNIPVNGKIAYNTREYSFDNPITELVRHTIEYMRSSNTFKYILTSNEEVKTAVETIINSTPLYNRMERNKILSKTSRSIKSPYFYKYRDLQKICRMILLHEKIKYDSSENKIYGLLFDGAWLWEEYLATILKKKGYEHPENKKKNGVIHPFTDNRTGRFYPDFYKPKEGHSLNEELADIILDAKYKNFDEHNPPADDIAQMISYIHVMDARLGEFVYPSKEVNKSGANWIIRPFANTTAELKTKPFLIPQNVDDYLGFKSRMHAEEDMLIK
jgi:5-methylcytosine-specific restriction endonuclease McrBC regulatory subunit McrC